MDIGSHGGPKQPNIKQSAHERRLKELRDQGSNFWETSETNLRQMVNNIDVNDPKSVDVFLYISTQGIFKIFNENDRNHLRNDFNKRLAEGETVPEISNEYSKIGRKIIAHILNPNDPDADPNIKKLIAELPNEMVNKVKMAAQKPLALLDMYGRIQKVVDERDAKNPKTLNDSPLIRLWQTEARDTASYNKGRESHPEHFFMRFLDYFNPRKRRGG